MSHRQRSKPFRLILLASVFLALVLPAELAARETKPSETQELLSDLGPFSPDKRVRVHAVMNDLFLSIWQIPGKGKKIASAQTSTFANYPVLLITDRNRDKVPDQFAYLRAKNDLDTKEFGFFFDLDRDGATDYLIFFGGPMPRESTKEFDVWWMNYHAIDSNGDGRADQVLYQGSSDMDGNGKVEPEVGLWLIDADYDGAIDAAEYAGGGFDQAVPVKDGQFDFARNMILAGKQVHPGDPIGALWDRILADINGALATQRGR